MTPAHRRKETLNTTQNWPTGTFVSRLTVQERAALLRLGKRESFRDGSYLLRQRDNGREVFVLITGRVEIMMLDRRSREQRIALRVPGDLVGEMAFVDGRPRSASVVATGGVTAQRLPRDGFNRFFDEFPDAYRLLVRTVIDRLRASDSRQLEIGVEVEARLAALLCQLAATDGDGSRQSLIVRHTQRELGRMIGASTVSVHRALRKLAGRDCIRTEYREIVILDFEALASIAGPRTILHRLM